LKIIVETLKGTPLYEKALKKEKDGYVYVSVMSEQKYKTEKQNNLFHSLLSIFWCSGHSSYNSYEELRNHYKKIAGLIERKGNKEIHKSWAEVKKKDARNAIDILMREMDEAGVIFESDEYKSILETLGEAF